MIANCVHECIADATVRFGSEAGEQAFTIGTRSDSYGANIATALLAIPLHFGVAPSDVLEVEKMERAMRADRTERAAVNQQRSLKAFLAAKAAFDVLVRDLQAMSADHFGADPEAVLWGHAANVTDWTRLLREVTDGYHRRGEFAPG